MSVSKNKVTSSLLKSEKQSLKRFFTLYVTIVLLMLALIAVYYYQSQEKLMLAGQRDTLSKYALIQAKRLKVLHQFFDTRTTYPRDPRFKSAIYALEMMQFYWITSEFLTISCFKFLKYPLCQDLSPLMSNLIDLRLNH